MLRTPKHLLLFSRNLRFLRDLWEDAGPQKWPTASLEPDALSITPPYSSTFPRPESTPQKDDGRLATDSTCQVI